MPTIDISNGTALENEYVTFTVTLSEPLTDEATVEWRTLTTGTANDDDLYYAPTSRTNNGTITFSPGETTATINVYARGDNDDERDENFVVEPVQSVGKCRSERRRQHAERHRRDP